MKQVLFEYLNDHLAPSRAEYRRLMEDPGQVERQLEKGAEKARAVAVPFITEIRHAVGIRKLG
jgi:tryptophanyl-tRNA synthetase